MDYARINQLGIILGLIGSCLALLIALISDISMLIALQRSLITFVILWLITQVVFLLISALVFKIQDEIKTELNQQMIEDQKKKAENSVENASKKLKNTMQTMSEKLNDKLEVSKERIRKGSQTDVTIDN